MRFLKKLLIRIIIAAILFLAKEYINLDNDLVNSLIIIIISTFLLDFNTFSLEITKVFFNGEEGEGSNRQNNNTPEEGEGSNRQNNNTPNQDSSINPPSFEEAPEEEGMLEELIEDEEDRAFRDEETRLMAQIQLREEVISINEQALFEKRIDMDRRIRDFEDLKNQSESDESMIPVLADIKRQLDEDIEALNEYTNVINDETRASNAEVGKLLLDNEKKRAALRLKKGISESESDSE